MTLPTSFKPLRKAVIAALTTSTGKPRALASGHLFAQAAASERHQRGVTTKAAPRALVVIKNARPDVQGGVLQGTDIQRDMVTVEITLWYYAGSELFSAETTTALDRIDEDTPLIVAALCQPGALVLDPSSNPTGIDGGSLRVELWSSQGPDLIPVQQSPTEGRRIFRVVHTFVTGIELQQPT